MDDFKELSTYKGWDWDVYMIRLTICMYQKKEKEKKDCILFLSMHQNRLIETPLTSSWMP